MCRARQPGGDHSDPGLVPPGDRASAPTFPSQGLYGVGHHLLSARVVPCPTLPALRSLQGFDPLPRSVWMNLSLPRSRVRRMPAENSRADPDRLIHPPCSGEEMRISRAGAGQNAACACGGEDLPALPSPTTPRGSSKPAAGRVHTRVERWCCGDAVDVASSDRNASIVLRRSQEKTGREGREGSYCLRAVFWKRRAVRLGGQPVGKSESARECCAGGTT